MAEVSYLGGRMLMREKVSTTRRLVMENLKAMSLILSIPVVQLVYYFLNQSPEVGTANSLVTDLDRAIPFFKVFVLPYVIWSPFLFLTLVYLCCTCRDVYYKTLTALITGFLMSCGVYLVYQTTVPRPELVGSGLLTQTVSLVYLFDQPYNCFPSIHSFTSFLMIKAMNQASPHYSRYRRLVKGMAVLIICSTVFIKQHVILDAAAGVILGEVLYSSVDALEKNRFYRFSDQKKAA